MVWSGAMSDDVRDRLRRTPVLFHAAKTAQEALRAVRRTAWTAARGSRIARYLQGPGPHGLLIGAGHHPPAGWLATDLDPGVAPGVVFLDATQAFPFPDASFDRVHSEHVIEHVPLSGGRAMLAEVRRVLRPGGRIRIATPDLARLAALVADPPSAGVAGGDYVRWIAERFGEGALEARPVDVLNHAMRAWGHVFLYDEPTLRAELARAGFTGIMRCAMNESGDPGMRGLETHAQAVGGAEHVAWETMVLEAVR